MEDNEGNTNDNIPYRHKQKSVQYELVRKTKKTNFLYDIVLGSLEELSFY